jgi:transposase-like protein
MQSLRKTPEFKEQALSKASQRGSRTLQEVAAELNVPVHTLKGSIKESLTGKAALGTIGVYRAQERRGS